MAIYLKLGADLHTAQLTPLPLTVSSFSKIQIGFAFLVPAHPSSAGQRAVKRVCVRVPGWAGTRRNIYSLTPVQHTVNSTSSSVIPTIDIE